MKSMDALALFRQLKQFYIEFGDEEEWGEVYSTLLEIPDAAYTTFIKLGYFRRCSGPVQRFQDIPSHFHAVKSPVRLFVSHKWQAKDHPDKSRSTLRRLLQLTQHCDDDVGIWFDYCSLPQRNAVGEDDRSSELLEFFKFQLSLIPLIILDSQSMFLWSDEGINSGWCSIELLIAQALLQHLNRMIYARKDEFKKPPLFVTQVGNNTLVETDLVSFDYSVVQKMYCSEAVMQQHGMLIRWMNEQLNNGDPIPYTQLIRQVGSELISQM